MVKTTFITVISLLLIGVAAFAQSPFRSDGQAYQFGYEEGYRHGTADSEMGLNFDYTHSHRFQSGISWNSYTNARFRSGYIQGYKDGFYSSDSDYRDRDDSYREYNDFDRNLDDYDSGGFVTVFTSDGFSGNSRAMRVGQYPYLNENLHESIDSIEINGPMQVILFDRPNFQGKRIVLQQNVSDLDDFNFGDRAESMIVERLD